MLAFTEILTREEILRVLKSMGVDLPLETKLSDKTLDQRLRDALNASQGRDGLTKSSSLDFKSLKKWPMANPGELDTSARLVFDAIRRGNMDEARHNIEAEHLNGGSSPPNLFVNPFVDLRQTLMSIGKWLDAGATWCVLQDQEKEQCAVNVRMVSVLEINEETPAIVVLYRLLDRSTALEGAEWVQTQSRYNAPALGRGSILITANPLEQKLLLRLLKLNASLLPADYPVKRQPGEESYKLSVLLPVGPLEFDTVAKLNDRQGCSVCGNKTTSRCSQCQSVSYCGQECQRADWAAHKQTCRSLKGGRWCTTPFRRAIPGLEDMFVATVNKYSTPSNIQSTAAGLSDDPKAVAKIARPNIWGDKLFLLKFQTSLTQGVPPYMMIYDMKRSLQVFFVPEDDPALFTELMREMTGPRGGYGGVKMYRWAKRTGDWQFEVCVDREPKTVTKW